MKKKWTKQEFIEETRRQMANITDPKRTAAQRCRKGARRYAILERKAQMKKRRHRDA